MGVVKLVPVSLFSGFFEAFHDFVCLSFSCRAVPTCIPFQLSLSRSFATPSCCNCTWPPPRSSMIPLEKADFVWPLFDQCSALGPQDVEGVNMRRYQTPRRGSEPVRILIHGFQNVRTEAVLPPPPSPSGKMSPTRPGELIHTHLTVCLYITPTGSDSPDNGLAWTLTPSESSGERQRA